jgi:hypothetical protein
VSSMQSAASRSTSRTRRSRRERDLGSSMGGICALRVPVSSRNILFRRAEDPKCSKLSYRRLISRILSSNLTRAHAKAE